MANETPPPSEAQQRIETTVPTDIEVHAVTNFQIVPENGGFVLILGKRRFAIGEQSFGGFPKPVVEVFAAAFLSHSMLKDMAKVFSRASDEFEKMFGHIPVPGLTEP
jgi:hypothetical protein